MRFRLLILFLLISGFSIGQQPTKMTWSKIGTIKPRDLKEDWRVQIQNQEMPSPDGEDYKAMLLRRKAELARKYPRKYSSFVPRDNHIPLDSLPLVDTTFEGNPAGNGTPNDNTLCISNDGILLSSINSNLYFYDTEADTLMFDASLGAFTLPLNITSGKYDPKLVYDNEQDRFVLIFLHGYSSSQSAIIACFSSSPNPMDPWNMYKIEGNPFDSTQWTDYPAINLTKEELFVTGNLLGDGLSWQQGFQGTIIWQIDKFTGYNGDSVLTGQVWGPVDYNGFPIRNLHPVRVGRGIYTDNQYFLSNRNFAVQSDTFYLVEITDKASGTPQLNVDLIRSPDDYFLAVNVPEDGGQMLQTNDSRVLGAILEGDTIQFVGNTSDTSSGNAAFYFGTLDLSSQDISLEIIGDTLWNYGYPNIAYTGIDYGEQSCMVSFEYCPTMGYPGYATIFRNDTGTWTNVRILRQGDTYINVLSGTDERWGDYSGIQRKYNEPCKIWCSGTFGKNGNDNGTWIAKVGASDTCRTLPDPPAEPDPGPDYDGEYDGKIFPNPAGETFSMAFTLEEDREVAIGVYDVNGRLIRILYDGMIEEGENLLSFSTVYLSHGIYILRMVSGDEILLTKKIVKR